MKKAFAILMAIVFATMTVVPAMAAKEDPLDTAIREASTYLNGKIPQNSKVAFVNVAGGYPDLSDYVLGNLTRNGVNDGKFTVVDRAQLDAVRAELNFNASGEVSDSSAQAIGQVLGAQTIVTGGVRKVGSNFRLEVRAIEVQTAKIQGDWSSKNIPNKNTIADLTKRTGSTSTATAAASGGKSGGASTGSTAAAAPAAPALKNGTYTYWPRPRATVAGGNVNWWLDKVVVNGKYLTVYVSTKEKGADYYDSDNRYRWAGVVNGEPTVLDSIDTRGRQWKPVRFGQADSNYDGEYFVFENVTGKRFTLYSDYDMPALELEFTIPDEPDSN